MLRADSGALYQCEGCSLIFRFPVPTAEQLNAAYESMPIDKWNYVAPPRWGWVAEQIRQHAPNRRVLDVGCFRGDFLNVLPKEYERFGVEPSPSASDVAASRGVKILARDALDELAGHEDSFGAIVLMDVAEHLADPARVFRHQAKYLAPGGLLIVLTGNADYWLARRSLPFYWYMSFPVHLTYLSRRYFRWYEKSVDWKMVGLLYYSHQSNGMLRRLNELGQGVRLILWRRILEGNWLGKLLGPTRLFRKLASAKSPPLLFSVKDHIGVALKKI